MEAAALQAWPPGRRRLQDSQNLVAERRAVLLLEVRVLFLFFELVFIGAFFVSSICMRLNRYRLEVGGQRGSSSVLVLLNAVSAVRGGLLLRRPLWKLKAGYFCPHGGCGCGNWAPRQ